MINYTPVLEMFLRYVQVDTQSDEDSTTTPSTMKQHNLAKMLVQELETMGAVEITYDAERCYVYASVPASQGYEKAPVLGFIAHMDTSPAVSGANVKPRIVDNYDGGDIVLNKELNIVMKTTLCNGMDVAKVSDTPGKGMCKNEEYVDYLQRCINWRMEH